MSSTTKLHFAILALLTAGAFSAGLSGKFVYDDERQILMNTAIQQPALYAKALTTDVWSFKSGGDMPASNYYRPTFTAWLIVNFALFGPDPFGWHLLNLLLHIAVTLLAYMLCRRLDLSDGVCVIIAAVFAVHPAHVESVSWISGSPDLLFGLFLLCSLLLVMKWQGTTGPLFLIASFAFYVLALGAKESAMLCFPIFYFVLSLRRSQDELNEPTKSRILGAYAFLAAAFFVIRWWVVGGLVHPVTDPPSVMASLMSVPSVFLFYIRQIVFPLTLAENYPLRPVESVSQFLLFTLLALAVAAAIMTVARRSRLGLFGMLVFLLPLLPALYVRSFPSEQIVHDRYLYVSLLGFLILTGSFFDERLSNVAKNTKAAVAAISLIIVAAFTVRSVVYERVWQNDLTLWSHTATIDQDSSATLVQYASALSLRGRHPESADVYDKAIKIKPNAAARLGHAREMVALGQFEIAISELNEVLNIPAEKIDAYTMFLTYEALAIGLSGSGCNDEAEQRLVEARGRLPIYKAALTDKLAVVLYNNGQKEKALAELNSVRGEADKELLPASRSVFFRLGMLESELGDTGQAAADLQHFLDTSAAITDPDIQLERRQAMAKIGIGMKH